MKDLKKGSTGSDVKFVQHYCNLNGYRDNKGRNLLEDGIFGDLTKQAVKKMQSANGLKPDGYIGPVTRQKMGWELRPVAANTSNTPSIIIQGRQALGGIFNTATEMYQLFISNIYSYYYNDQFDLSTELNRLSKHLGLNCSDVSQVGRKLIEGLNQMGKKYQVIYISAQFRCGGHVFLQVKGEEFGDTWTNFDLAGAMKWDYTIGKLMCSGPYKVKAIDPAWLMSDDART